MNFEAREKEIKSSSSAGEEVQETWSLPYM